jgi:hypothetical protein
MSYPPLWMWLVAIALTVTGLWLSPVFGIDKLIARCRSGFAHCSRWFGWLVSGGCSMRNLVGRLFKFICRSF